ncbi:MAG: DUF1684 domain-containing protein [Saprospiraceae bacterium]|nr:DUF1684 domain-containing protein [Saprospiraceae bacterium]
MKNTIILWFILVSSTAIQGQDSLSVSFYDAFEDYKANYLADRSNEDGPISPEEAKDIHFFEADTSYVVLARVELLDQKDTLTMPTANGKQKDYVKYAYLHFEIQGKASKLLIFRSVRLMKNPLYRNALFLPFYDYSNGSKTYGGGRYMDLSISDIDNKTLMLDFNRCYNPYCAYTTGYSCPIPPEENTLELEILAGESAYGKK